MSVNDVMFVRTREEEAAWVAVPATVVNGVVVDSFEEKLRQVLAAEDDARAAEPQVVYVDHIFESRDNMQLLSLRYGASERDILRANRLVGGLDFVEVGTTLRIPATRSVEVPAQRVLSTEEKQDKAVRVFVRLNLDTITREEARFYLDDNEWDLRKAYHARATDLEWEQNQPKPMPPPSKLTTGQQSKKRFNFAFFKKRAPVKADA